MPPTTKTATIPKTKEAKRLEQMLAAGVHLGHQKSKWHPRMRPFVYTIRHNIHIIDLEATDQKLSEAKQFLKTLAQKDKTILLLGTKRQGKQIIKQAAESLSMPSVTERWLGGTLTNWKTIQDLIEKLEGLRQKLSSRSSDALEMTKRERGLIKAEVKRLEQKIGGLEQLDKLPDALFVLDTKEDKTAIREAKRLGIPIIAVIDTNNDPLEVDYPIPANNDSVKSIEFIVKEITQAIHDGQKSKKQ